MSSVQALVVYGVILAMILVTFTALFSLKMNKRVLIPAVILTVFAFIVLYYNSDGRAWLKSLIPQQPKVKTVEID